MRITIDMVQDFLADENLGPTKIKNETEDNWSIQINEPSFFGTNDTKFRCGIANIYLEKDDKYLVLFNAFKAYGKFGDDYKGNFISFVKLIKGFNLWTEAKDWFEIKYGLTGSDIINLAKHNINLATTKEKEDLVFPEHYEKLNPKLKSHKPFIDYL